MKQNSRWQQALGLSVLLHAALLGGIGWISPFAAPPPAAPLEIEFINADMTLSDSSLPSNASQPPQSPDIAEHAELPSSFLANNHTMVTDSSETAPNAVSGSPAGSVDAAGGTSSEAPKGISSAGTPKSPASTLKPPQILHKVEPAYPEEARRLGLEGKVVVRLEVSINGLPGEATIQQSSGQRLLDGAAIRAVKHWRFIPAKDAGGTPVLSVIAIPIVFKLDQS